MAEYQYSEQVIARMTPNLRKRLDALASETSIKSSDIIRTAIYRFLDEAEEKMRNAKSVEDYRWALEQVRKGKERDRRYGKNSRMAARSNIWKDTSNSKVKPA